MSPEVLLMRKLPTALHTGKVYLPDPRGKHMFNVGIIKQDPASKSMRGIEFRHRQEMSRHLYLDEV